MKPIRVLHLIHRVAFGGTEYGVLKLVNHLDRARFLPSVAGLEGSRPEALAELKSDVHLYECRRGEGLDFRLPFRLARECRTGKVEIIHSHNWGTYAYAVAAARLARVPVVIHGEHGADSASREIPPQRALLRRLLARGTDHFTVVSAELRDRLVQDWRIPPDRITLIPNGVDLIRIGPRDRAAMKSRLGFSSTDPLIGTVATFRPVKDVGTLIRAFTKVRETLSRSRLVLAGWDPGEAFQLELAREPGWEQIRDGVHFLGVRSDISEVLSALDVYVNSSVYEGMSNTILEAMACALPVVATNVGGTPDLVVSGETGWLVPVKDPAILASRILDLLQDSATAREMGERGRRRVEQNHSFAEMIHANERLYESLLAGKLRQ